MNVLKNGIRVFEKTPGVNLLQVAHFGSVNVLMFPKVGTRSIRNAVLAFHQLGTNPADAWAEMSYVTRHRFGTRYNGPTTKVILRDPLERLQSCWKQKISDRRDPGSFYFFQYYPLLRPDMPFIDFLKGISKIPTGLYEKHFMPLAYFLRASDDMRYEFLPLERLDQTLQEIIGPRITVPRANTTGRVDVDGVVRAFYETHLKSRFSLDETLYRKHRGFAE